MLGRRQNGTRSRSVRGHVVRLVVAVTLPLLVFGAFLLIRSANNEQQAIATTVHERAQGAAADLDRELRNLQVLVSMLAAAPHVFVEDSTVFNRYLSGMLNDGALGIVVGDPSGQLLVNTCTANRRAFPVTEMVDNKGSVAGYEKPHISDLVEEPTSGDPLLTIDLAVLRQENSPIILSLCALPRILQILVEQHLPAGWIAAVIDGQGRAIASIRESPAGSFAAAGGEPATMSTLDDASIVDELSNSGLGYSASSSIYLAGWTVAVSVSNETFFGPVRRALAILFLAGGGTIALVLVLAVNIGRKIAGPISDLTETARTIGNGGQVSPRLTGISEADLVSQVLCSTSKDLNRRTTELTQTVEALRNRENQLQKLSNELQKSLDERTKLLARMVSAQESERQRIARELHDHLGQYFAAMLLGLNAAHQATGWDDMGQRKIADLKTMTSAMSREIHQLSWELRPTALDDLGLEAAMANYLEKWRERFNRDVVFMAQLQGDRLSAPVEITLYRVLQEAMTNVAKHAQAERISVVLESDRGGVQLIVEDDGTGFGEGDPGAATKPTGGYGLLGIRERLALVGGSLIIETAPNRGTALFCRVPA
jgi:signal transduction histidine kinase